MADLREVFEMTINQMGEPDVDSWREQEKRHRNASRNKKIGAFALAAAIAVVAIAWIVGTSGGQDTTTPANQPTGNPTGKTAVDVATDFFHAYSSFNEDQAVSMLADDADVSGFGLDGTREFRLLTRFWEATGFEHILDSCVETSSLPSGTIVRCTYDFHGLRSDEIGRGPYSGNYEEITVLDGDIVDVSLYFDPSKFGPQMWQPFAAWVLTNYPDDVAVMYKPANLNPLGDYRLTPESIRLWERHTREYVKEVKQETA